MTTLSTEQISTLLRITAREACETPRDTPEWLSLVTMIGDLASILEARLDAEDALAELTWERCL